MTRYIQNNQIVSFPMINLPETGKRIKQFRIEKGISVRNLADIMQFEAVQAVYNWQEGKTLPSLENIMLLSEIFEKSFEELIVFE